MALNPPALNHSRERTVIDVSAVLGSGLFGGAPEALAAEAATSGIESDREGIEQDAKETRLALKLTGIVASTDDGLGSAVIKAGAKEQVYAVGDMLPASGRVTLAKVMPTQVVIDNNGTYELIKLYEGPGLVIPTRAASEPEPGTVQTMAAARDMPTNLFENAAERSALAGQYRQQLYDNPESLANAVSVAPVRAGDQLVGYRISPGADTRAFDTFGFKRGDVVVAVNGLTLSDASNLLKLYQLMKEASQATFDIERDGGTVTISVDLASP
jgi:general secretion pathway protein C